MPNITPCQTNWLTKHSALFENFCSADLQNRLPSASYKEKSFDLPEIKPRITLWTAEPKNLVINKDLETQVSPAVTEARFSQTPEAANLDFRIYTGQALNLIAFRF